MPATLRAVKPIYIFLVLLAVPGTLGNLFLSEPSSWVEWLIWAGLLVVYTILSGISIHLGQQVITGQTIDLGQATHQALRRTLSLILTAILQLLIIVPGLVALVIPGIYLAVRLFGATYAALLENKSPLEAITYSWTLTKGRWWSVFGVIIFLIACSLILMLPLTLIGAGLGTLTQNLWITAGFLNLATLVVSPLYVIYLLLAFNRLNSQSNQQSALSAAAVSSTD